MRLMNKIRFYDNFHLGLICIFKSKIQQISSILSQFQQNLLTIKLILPPSFYLLQLILYRFQCNVKH